MIKLKNVLKEIGEASAKPYKWKAEYSIQNTLDNIQLVADETFKGPTSTRVTDALNYDYHFTSDQTGTKYTITIDMMVGRILKLPFLKPTKPITKKKYFLECTVAFDTDRNTMEDTNLNEQYRVMATVVDCIKDFITGVESSELFRINEIGIFPKADDETRRSSIGSKRGKLYKAYIEKQIKSLPYKASVETIQYGSDDGYKINIHH
jgi:hypothetical protein